MVQVEAAILDGDDGVLHGGRNGSDWCVGIMMRGQGDADVSWNRGDFRLEAWSDGKEEEEQADTEGRQKQTNEERYGVPSRPTAMSQLNGVQAGSERTRFGLQDSRCREEKQHAEQMQQIRILLNLHGANEITMTRHLDLSCCRR
jgi:hypothetical protein